MFRRRINLNLYHKFVILIVCTGIIPIFVLATGIMNRMFKEYEKSLLDSYGQALRYAGASVENLLESYNEISKICYFYSYGGQSSFRYDYMNYDNLRKIIEGVNYIPDEIEVRRQQDMNAFLRNIIYMGSYIKATHFIAAQDSALQDGSFKEDIISFHYEATSAFLQSKEIFYQRIGFDSLNRESRGLIIVPTHPNDYYFKRNDSVITIGRNYFDISGKVGHERYVGTLYIDIGLEIFKSIFESIDLYNKGSVYISNQEGDCLYSNHDELNGVNLYHVRPELLNNREEGRFFLQYQIQGTDLTLYYNMEIARVYEHLKEIQTFMYFIVAGSILALFAASVVFSKKITKPIRNMMRQMSEIETGNFKVELPVLSGDEIGVLSQRFNRMSRELENYINQSYLAQIKQREAELKALKSQIYPHFLYNTLEIIRMTAVSHKDEMVSNMIESLSDQIRYVIGNVDDLVPLSEEITILNKYLYLINCRFGDTVIFETELGSLGKQKIPKLILQPIVENAFVHGIKPKEGKGHILITAEYKDDKNIEIAVFDNGMGMSWKAKEKLDELLASDKPGIMKNYQWESIGLKNVHDRLRFLYGKEYGIRISSQEYVGTAVQILIPRNLGGETEHVENDFSR